MNLENHVLNLVNEIKYGESWQYGKQYEINYFSYGEHCNDYATKIRQKLVEYSKQFNVDYVLFLDDDNTINPNYLHTMSLAIENSGKDFAICNIIHFGPVQSFISTNFPFVLKGEPVKLFYVDTLNGMFKWHVINDLGWSQDGNYLSDGNTFERIAEKYQYVKVNEILGIHW